MGAIVRAALRFRALCAGAALVLIVVGPALLRDAPLDVFPEFAPPRVEIQTEAPGLSTDEVEALITVQLENAVIGTPWVETVRSKSVLGLSSVTLLFRRGTDLMAARQLVQERVARVAPELPALARAPVILSPLSSTSRVMKIGITSDTLSQIEMTTLAKWTVRPRLMAVPGVANVAIWGQRDRQLQVLVDPDRLRANGVTLDQVVQATRDATTLAAGGFVDTPNQRLAVTQVTGLVTAADLARMPVAVRPGLPLTLGDVADVIEGHPAPIGDGIINDGPGLLLIVEKQPWGNTLDVTRGVEDALRSLGPGLADVTVDPTIFRPATFIEMSLHNLTKALVLGGVLVVLLLVAFLRDWRSAFISVLAIPLSLLTAALIIRYQGGTINTMVLAGLIIALGEVVDDAIIDVENIMRRLRLNAQLPEPEPAFRVVFDASMEVRSAVVYGTLIVLVVFLPVLALGGLSGAFFRPLAYSYILAILASLVVALTLTPALALMLLPGRALAKSGDSPVVVWLKRRYRQIIPWFLARPRWCSGMVLGSTAAALVVFPLLGEEFLPRFKEYDFLMHWVEKPGTSIEAMDRITIAVSGELRAIPGVRNFGAHIGRAEVADEVVGPNFTELWISLEPGVDYDGSVQEIQRVVDGYPGLYRDVLTYLRERIKEVLTGQSATIVIRLAGGDLDVLRSLARELAGKLEVVPGVADLHVQPQVLVPQIQVRLLPDRAAALGLTPGMVQHAVTTLVNGVTVGQVYQDQMVFDVAVWGVPRVRRDVAALRAMMIDAPAGGQVALRDVAEVSVVPMRNEVTREGATRKIDVTLNVVGRDLGRVARDVDGQLAELTLPSGYRTEVLGEYAERAASQQRLLGLGVLALGAILLLLYSDFQSGRLTAIVFVTLPFSLVGSVAAVVATGGTLSLGSLVGLVTVIGIAARNGIMLISHYRHLEAEEGVPFGLELVRRGAEERLAPILMTALATALALLPIALGGARPGYEIEHPMAIVILGGLLTSTAMNLLLAPALYLRYGKGA